jgi:sugar phosphate isomerase/epimerase
LWKPGSGLHLLNTIDLKMQFLRHSRLTAALHPSTYGMVYIEQAGEAEMINRRGFIGQAGALALLGGAAPVWAKGAGKARPFGIQLWSVAKMLADDFEGTIAWLASLGYRELETYGPYPFSDERNQASWKAVTPGLGFSGSGFFGRSVTQVGALFRQHGLRARSMHTDLYTLQTNMGALAEAAHALGASYVTLPSLAAELPKTIDDYKKAADLLNKIGADATRHGVRFAYHNHGYGLSAINGQVPLDVLLAATDPAHVFFELDTYWTLAGGADPVDYLTRYKGRYKMVHLKDMKGHHRFSGDGGTSNQWIEMFQYLTYLGDGTADMKGIIAAAEKSGVEHFFVEQDRAEDLKLAVRSSAAYLKQLGFR